MSNTLTEEKAEQPLNSVELIAADDTSQEAATMAEAALRWHTDHLDEYDPLTWQDKKKRQVRRKSFGELSLFVRVLSQYYDRSDHLESLADHIDNTVNDRTYFELFARNPQQVLQYGYPFVVPANRGTLEPEAKAALERTMERRSPWAPERYPFVQFHYYHFLQQLGYDTRHLDPETILTASNAHITPNFLECERRQVYELTHNVFYYTNFGIPAAGFPDTVVPTDLSTTLTGLILRFLTANDTDAVSELLMTGILQRQLSPEFVQLIFSWLRTVATDRNTIPGSGIRDATASPEDQFQNSTVDTSSLGNWSESSERWFHDYHTVIASGLCFAALEREWDAVRKQAPTRDLDHTVQDNVDQLMMLGELIELLSEYKLSKAAPLMESLAGTPTARAYDDVFDVCVAFLRHQRTHDGHIGFFSDERTIFLNSGGDLETFERKLHAPCTEQCENALAAVKRSRDSTDQ